MSSRWGLRALATLVALITLVGVPNLPAVAAGSTLTGTVYLGSNSTTAGAGEVTVQYMRAGTGPVTGQEVVTDENGRFTITGLGSGRWWFYYRYTGTGPWFSAWFGSSPYSAVPAGRDRIHSRRRADL